MPWPLLATTLSPQAAKLLAGAAVAAAGWRAAAQARHMRALEELELLQSAIDEDAVAVVRNVVLAALVGDWLLSLVSSALNCRNLREAMPLEFADVYDPKAWNFEADIEFFALFDMDLDPFQLHNVYSGASAARKAELHAELLRANHCRGQGGVPGRPACP